MSRGNKHVRPTSALVEIYVEPRAQRSRSDAESVKTSLHCSESYDDRHLLLCVIFSFAVQLRALSTKPRFGVWQRQNKYSSIKKRSNSRSDAYCRCVGNALH